VGLRIAHQAALFGPELSGLTVEELVVDAPVELVEVHGVDPLLKATVFALELRNRFAVELLLVGVAFA